MTNDGSSSSVVVAGGSTDLPSLAEANSKLQTENVRESRAIENREKKQKIDLRRMHSFVRVCSVRAAMATVAPTAFVETPESGETAFVAFVDPSDVRAEYDNA